MVLNIWITMPHAFAFVCHQTSGFTTQQYGCDSGVLRKLVQAASSVTTLEIEFISGLNDVVWRGVSEYLGAVEEITINECNEIRYLWESAAAASKNLVKLRSLRVHECQSLVRLGEKEEVDNGGNNLITTLMKLDIDRCQSLEHCGCPNNIVKLDISHCASVTSVSFPAEGQKLTNLFMVNCDKLLEKDLGGGNTRVLFNNKSMQMLEKVGLFNWKNLTTIIELSQLIHLTTLIIFNCPNMESFPDQELPNLTSLTYLFICYCPSIDASFPRGFWPPKLSTLIIGGLKKPILEWGPQNFPTSLVSLALWSGQSKEDDAVSRCSQLSHLLPSSLTTLGIVEFKRLKSVSARLQHLTSLKHFVLWNCPKMMNLPEILLPSLLSLHITGCPRLEGRCSRRGAYWPRISHIPCIRIDTDLYDIFTQHFVHDHESPRKKERRP